jgi:urea transport system substrate-binding protein
MSDRRKFLQLATSAGIGLGLSALPRPISAQDRRPIKVGILHSLSGTMAISEKSTVDAELLAIEEINKSGGVLGRPIEPIIEDGDSNWETFAKKAKKLIEQDQVTTIFGCWTSASRKSVLPTIENKNHMLWYPVVYEGQECSQNVFYTGAVPNQQIEPAVDWLSQAFKNRPFFLIGSDYVYPRVVNTVMKNTVSSQINRVVGEDYVPLGVVEMRSLVRKIRRAMPQGGIIFNSLNGDSNVSFFKALYNSGLTPRRYPTLSVSIAEEEVLAIGVEYLQGHYAAWNYFQTVNTAANRRFVTAFKRKYGVDRIVNDPMQAAYISVYLWKKAVEKAGTAEDLEKVRRAARGISIDAPEGRVTLTNNHHLSRTVRIGRVRRDGLFDIVYQSKGAIAPQPWNQLITETRGYACDWSDPNKGRKYRTR